MCGINGIFAFHPASNAIRQSELELTRDYMATRGPDGFGAWVHADRRVGLGHRRLAIQDLSDAGAQPMLNPSASLAVTFNGEIYNYPQLRRKLEASGAEFRSDCDTELLLHLYEAKGPEMVRELRGMFAFAIYDVNRRGLFLARDPYGIKPLYVANDGWTFRFASQVKALLAGGGVSRAPEPAGIVGFYLFGSVPEPYTLFRDIRSLPAGSAQWVDALGPQKPVSYASVTEVLSRQSSTIAPGDFRPLFSNAVRQSVAAHMLSDVEVGLFLSAGIDSTTILGVLADLGYERVPAVTLRFNEFNGSLDDEAPEAARMASFYGARHFVRNVTKEEFRSDLPRILEAMDQPSIDGINSWFVSKAAREIGLKVALSGIGGDELFGGYPSFTDLPRWTRLMRVPSCIPGLGTLTRVLARGLRLSKDNPKRNAVAEYGGNYPGAYLLRRGLFLPFELREQLDPEIVRVGLNRLKPLRHIVSTALTPRPASAMAKVCSLESMLYLKNQLLRDCDWASMAHGLEVRTPLVDFELLQSIAPLLPQLSADTGKQWLSEIPRNVPQKERTIAAKTGFQVPTAAWLESPISPRSASRGMTSRGWAQFVMNRGTVWQ